VTKKGYPGTACCEIGQNIPSDSCPAKIQTTTKVIISAAIAGAVIVACLGVAFAFARRKKREAKVQIPVAVPFEVGNNINRTASDDINNIMMNSSNNASASVVGRYPEASAPLASVNPMLK
jgi:hypothetical protein